MKQSINLGNLSLCIENNEDSKSEYPLWPPIWGPIILWLPTILANYEKWAEIGNEEPSKESGYTKAELTKYLREEAIPALAKMQDTDGIHKVLSRVYVAHPALERYVNDVLKDPIGDDEVQAALGCLIRIIIIIIIILIAATTAG